MPNGWPPAPAAGLLGAQREGGAGAGRPARRVQAVVLAYETGLVSPGADG